MNLLQRLKAAFQADRQSSGASKWMQATTTVNQNGDAKRPDFDQRQAVAFYRSWIYAAASINAVAVASVPLRLYVRSNPSLKALWSTRAPSRRTKAYLAGDLEQRPSRFAMRKSAEYGEGYEEVTEMHPVTKLLAKVNPYQNGYDATVLRVLYTELCGNAYLNVVKDKALGIPVELYPMPPQYSRSFLERSASSRPTATALRATRASLSRRRRSCTSSGRIQRTSTTVSERWRPPGVRRS